MRKILFFITYLLFVCFLSKAQTIDSLLSLLNATKSDTIAIRIRAKISWEYRSAGNYKKALEYGEKALAEAEKIKFNTGIADACNALGAIYDEQGDYPKSLGYYTRTMKIHELQKDDAGICRDYNNIGLLYENLSNFTTALSYYHKALVIAEKLKDKRTLSAIYFNIGAVYTYINDYDKSSEYYFKSLKIDEELNDQLSISDCYTNIGINYTYLLQYDKAIKYCTLGLNMKESLMDINGMASGYINIGDIYVRQKNYDLARMNFEKALKLSIQTGSADNLRLAYQGLAMINYDTKQYKEAFDYHVKFKQLTDSMFNKENNEQLNQTKINYELEKKEAEQAQQKALADADKKRQNIIIISIILVLLIVCVFSLFLLKRFKITNQQKEIISQQKELVEEKQKEISDSINYAKRIQYALLASDTLLKNNLPEHFVFFKPKDVVSGDFYWASKIISSGGTENFVLVTADSTGHGVPGAIMSMLNISCLRESIADGHIRPHEILNATRKKIISDLSNDGSESGGKDGMDCSVMCFDFENKKMSYAAAHNPVWIIRSNELITLPSDRMPVGKHDKDQVSFTEHIMDLQTNDLIYTLTDGFPDQFGGPRGKKFKYKQLEELLLAIAQEPMHIQKERLNTALEHWQGNLEQVDDICIIGIRI